MADPSLSLSLSLQNKQILSILVAASDKGEKIKDTSHSDKAIKIRYNWVKLTKNQLNPVKPSKIQYNLIKKTSRTRYNFIKPNNN